MQLSLHASCSIDLLPALTQVSKLAASLKAAFACQDACHTAIAMCGIHLQHEGSMPAHWEPSDTRLSHQHAGAPAAQVAAEVRRTPGARRAGLGTGPRPRLTSPPHIATCHRKQCCAWGLVPRPSWPASAALAGSCGQLAWSACALHLCSSPSHGQCAPVHHGACSVQAAHHPPPQPIIEAPPICESFSSLARPLRTAIIVDREHAVV